jgi:hypothetical protein
MVRKKGRIRFFLGGVAPLEHLPLSHTGAVPALAVGAKQPLHADNQIRQAWSSAYQEKDVSEEIEKTRSQKWK